MNGYDFDNTIYDGESAVDFFFFYIRKDPKLICFLPLVALKLFKYKTGKITIESAFKSYEKLVKDYIADISDLEDIVSEFWDKHEHKIKPFYLRQQRDDDVIISSSPGILLDEIFKRIGVKHSICSEINPETGALEYVCFRENKAMAFKNKYPGVKLDKFYTDSVNDLPLLELANEAYMVKGNRVERIK